jgi:hypothetical protein
MAHYHHQQLVTTVMAVRARMDIVGSLSSFVAAPTRA